MVGARILPATISKTNPQALAEKTITYGLIELIIRIILHFTAYLLDDRRKPTCQIRHSQQLTLYLIRKQRRKLHVSFGENQSQSYPL